MSRPKLDLTDDERKKIHAERQREYRKTHKEQIKKKNRIYNQKNKEKIKVQHKQYLETHPEVEEKLKISRRRNVKAYRKKYPEKYRAYQNAYYHRNSKVLLERRRGKYKSKPKKDLSPEEEIERLFVQNEYHHIYYRKNRDKILKYQKKWCKENPEKIKAYQKNWATNNPEKRDQIARDYYYSHRAERLEYDRKARERRRAAKLAKAAQVEAVHA